MRRARIGSWAAASILSTRVATGQPDFAHAPAECVVNYRAAEERERSGHLREARDLLLACAKPSCEGFIRQVCAARVDRIDFDIPTILPVATDEKGTHLVDVQVTMDGELLTSRLDGQPLAVDPGVHEFSFRTDRASRVEKLFIAQGERNRPLPITLRGQSDVQKEQAPQQERAPQPSSEARAEKAAPEREARASPRRPRASPPTLAYLLLGVGLVGAAGGTSLLVWGKSDTLHLAVDSLAIAAGTLGVSIWLFAKPSPDGGSAGGQDALRPRRWIEVHPTASGAVAAFAGVY
jgi:hypothetical protein